MDSNILLLIIVGFLAQLIDGSLGMAYGVSATSFLLGIGVSPAAASASVHTAEIFTTAVSGISHWKLGNIDWKMVIRLAIPGILGGITGAYLLTNLPGEKIKPYITIYLLIMGIRILVKAFNLNRQERDDSSKFYLIPLGLVGGALDALGGGGWGPIVTSTLLSNNIAPRKTIGSVNFSEFFVTFSEVLTFIATIGLTHWRVILGLMIGGVVAAPLGAVLARRMPAKYLMIIVGVLIIFLQIRTLAQIWL